MNNRILILMMTTLPMFSSFAQGDKGVTITSRSIRHLKFKLPEKVFFNRDRKLNMVKSEILVDNEITFKSTETAVRSSTITCKKLRIESGKIVFKSALIKCQTLEIPSDVKIIIRGNVKIEFDDLIEPHGQISFSGRFFKSKAIIVSPKDKFLKEIKIGKKVSVIHTAKTLS